MLRILSAYGCLLGIGLLVAMKLFGREEWLLKAGQAAYEKPASSEEHK